MGGSSERLAALSAGTVDATPVDVAYIPKTEQAGFTNLLYLGDVKLIGTQGYLSMVSCLIAVACMIGKIPVRLK